MSKPVTENDFRLPEFHDAKVEDYERRSDGRIVRKDRWEKTCWEIAGLLGIDPREGFECDLLLFSLKQLIEKAKEAGVEPYYFDEVPK